MAGTLRSVMNTNRCLRSRAMRRRSFYADTPKAVQERRRAFLRKWRLRCPAVATSLEEAGDRLFAFLHLLPS